jgi:flagellum-specific peptidoglycan hydrolase FlgJ
MKLKTVLITLFLCFTLTTHLESGEVKSSNEFIITYEKLYEQIIKSGIKHPEIVFAQAILESGHFTSSLFERANNLFGMKVPTKRETVAIGNTNGYSKYETWHHSIYDYKLWQEFLFSKRGELSKVEYLAYLKKWYAVDKNYVFKVENKIKEFSFMLGS